MCIVLQIIILTLVLLSYACLLSINHLYPSLLYSNVFQSNSWKIIWKHTLLNKGFVQRHSSSIKPINPFKVLDGNEAIFTIRNSIEDNLKIDIKELFQIDYSNNESKISLVEREFEESRFKNILLDIEIPHNYDLVAKALAIHVKETEGKILNLDCVQECILGKIKSDQVNVAVSDGDLVCKSLLGNGCVSAANNVIICKVQSKHLDVRSDARIEISSVYCNQLKCVTDTGSIELGSLHGYSDLKSDSGSISVSCLAGDSNIQTTPGDISVTIES